VAKDQRIVDLVLEEQAAIRRGPQIEHERRVAIHDLLEENLFAPEGDFDGPFILHLGIEENRLIFNIHDEGDSPLISFTLPLAAFRTIVKDYFLLCDSYFKAIKTLSPSRIEAIDMGRRGLHNEGSEILLRRLAGKAQVDMDTARRLFTLICVLHIRTWQ
jgi:uncharacterized protein (UPF0262 family)